MKYSNNPDFGSSRGGAQARNARSRQGLLYAEAQNFSKRIRAAGRARDIPSGQATGMMLSQLKTINEKMATELQEMVAAKLESSRVESRKGVASGRLEHVILDARNRYVTPWVMGVGRPNFMDASAAKYWRSIEVGTDQFVGNVIKPGWLWGSSLTGEYGGRSRFGDYPLAGEVFSVTEAGRRDGRLRPMGPASAYRFLAAQGMRKRDAYLATRKMSEVKIEKAIEAHWMFRDAWRDFDGRARGTAALREALHYMGLLGPQ